MLAGGGKHQQNGTKCNGNAKSQWMNDDVHKESDLSIR